MRSTEGHFGSDALPQACTAADIDDIEVPGQGDAEASYPDVQTTSVEAPPTRAARRTRMLAYILLPALVSALAVTAGYLKWWEAGFLDAEALSSQSVIAASEGTVAILSYRPESVEAELSTAAKQLTGQFKNSYTELTRDVVVPGAREQNIAAAAEVVASALVSLSETHSVVMLFVNQQLTSGNNPPTKTSSTVRVTMNRVDGRWLIAAFEPI